LQLAKGPFHIITEAEQTVPAGLSDQLAIMRPAGFPSKISAFAVTLLACFISFTVFMFFISFLLKERKPFPSCDGKDRIADNYFTNLFLLFFRNVAKHSVKAEK
jgi:hypothetical protein